MKTLEQEAKELLTKIAELSAKLDEQKNKKQTETCPNCEKYKQILEATQEKLLQSKMQGYLESDDADEEIKYNRGLTQRNENEILKKKIQQMSKEMQAMELKNCDMSKQVKDLQETHSHLTAQLVAYKEDFENERSDRERAQGTISELRIQLQQAEQLERRLQQRHSATLPIITASRFPQAPPMYTAPAAQSFNISNTDTDLVIDSDEMPFTARSPQSSNLKARGPVYQCDGAVNKVSKTITDVPSSSSASSSTCTYTPTSGIIGRDRQQNRTIPPNGKTIDMKIAIANIQQYKDKLATDIETDSDSHEAIINTDNKCSKSDTLNCPICRQEFHQWDHYQLLLHMEKHAHY